MIRKILISLLALVFASQPAMAACDANNLLTFDWNTQPDTALNYANTYSYSTTNLAGATRTIQTSFATNGLATNQVSGIPMPVIAAVHTGTTGAGQKTLTIGGRFTARTPNINNPTRVLAVTFTFSQAVRDVSFRVFDVDFTNNSWRDWIKLIGRNGAAAYDASITKPAASTVKLGPSAVAPAIGTSEVLGTSVNDFAQDIGTIVVSFPQPVTSVELRYGNYPLQSGETVTGEQWISIHDISFCPLPNLAVAKSSAPYATSGPDRFNAPGSDVVYTLTATNSGGSPVDLNTTMLADILPPNVTFYNGDFNPALPGSGPVELAAGTSGVTMPGGSTTYSNNNGATYAYTPAAGYDAAVDAVRFAPTGSLAANSSFTLRFRARIN